MEKTQTQNTKNKGTQAVKHRQPLALSITIAAILITPTIPLKAAATTADIRARAAVVMDSQTGKILFAKNPTRRLAQASTVKLMTAILAAEKTKGEQSVTVSKRAANAPHTSMGLNKDDKVTIDILLGASLMISANDAAITLAEAIAGSEKDFVKIMNDRADHMGLSDTRYVNASGLPAAGQYTTAEDLARLTKEAIKNPLVKSLLSTREATFLMQDGKPLTMRNTNQTLWTEEPAIPGKTGYTRQAGHCFTGALETRQNQAIIVTILGAPSRTLLWKEAQQLADLGFRIANNIDEPLIYNTKPGKSKHKKTNSKHPKRLRAKKTEKNSNEAPAPET